MTTSAIERPAGSGRESVVTAESRFRPVPLEAHANNRAVTPAHGTADGAFNVWRNSFPAEHLPEPGSAITVDEVPFRFPEPTPAGDNLRCAGQYLRLPAGRYDWIHLLAAGERRVEAEAALHFADGEVDFEAVRVSDFWAAPARFGEREAFRTPVMHYPQHVQPGVPACLWAQRVPVTRRAVLHGIRLPRHIALHVFALTLESVTRSVAPSTAPEPALGAEAAR
ncbi:hypothetical protein ACFP3U_13040 [Kitasatospora misakiensis]|uniref:Uncharacterized protein n=1 Tax=Kitasatospora misakiensis TaxID=67330 RepID=A0ABW0X0E9_9ACTN